MNCNIRFPIAPVSYGKLAGASRPSNAGQPQSYADILFDTRTYVDNSTATLRFFQTTQSGETVSNMQSAGQLPSGNYFSIDRIAIDVVPDAGWATTAAGGVAGIANDLGLLFYQGQPVLTLTMNQKPYGPWPAIACGGLGSIDVYGYGTFTAEESIQFGQKTPGGLYIGQSLVIPPLTSFHIDIDWLAAQDLTDDYRVRVSLVGTRYREVV